MTHTSPTVTPTTRPDTYALCQHLSQARTMLAVLGTAAASACAQSVVMDAEQLGDYAFVLGGLVGDALQIANEIEDFCDVAPIV